MMNVPDEAIENYAAGMLKDKQQIEGLVSRTEDRKIGAKAKEVVKLQKKSVSQEEFNKLFQEEK
jgi:trigger factor